MNVTVEDLLGIGQIGALNMSLLKGKKFTQVSTDTRQIKPGALFFALRGQKVDGHNYVRDAFAKGASCAVVDERAPREELQNQPVVIVRDTTAAFGELACRYRLKFSIPVVAIGGSNGKTTTKDMIGTVLKKKYNVLQTQGNYNNHIGVPMTLFGLNNRHDIAVVEIGTNHFGEVKYLCDIARPTHALVTNIEHEHLEFFGSIDGVEREEGDLFRSLDSSGTAFINQDDERIVRQVKGVRKKITYGFSTRGKFRGTVREYNRNGAALLRISARGRKPYEIQLSVAGRHNASNALAAAVVGTTFNVPAKNIQLALHNFHAADKRMEILKVGGMTIINDTYNANADSVIRALSALGEMKAGGKKIIVLGDMLELGSASEAEHRRVGYEVNRMGFEYLLTFGDMTRHVNDAAGKIAVNLHFEQKNSLAEYALELIGEGDVVLIKGSRGMKMEDVVAFLTERGRRPAS